jgi:hypothetical protein
MPYYLEKGPFFSVLEHYVNTLPRAQLALALERLRAGDEWEVFEVFGSTTLQNPRQPDAPAWVKHINEHWFGRKKNAAGVWTQPAFHETDNPRTGYWQGYYGDVEKITRTTLIRALEVALGVDHGGTGPVTPTRRWPIEFLWKCSQSWFEGWVTWRRHGAKDDDGHVTVLFATPPVVGSVVLDSPVKGRNEKEFRIDPVSTREGPPWNNAATESRHGMWVVTHTNNKAYVVGSPTTASGTKSGEWPSPVPGRVRGTDAIVTVAPSQADGGVLADGLRFVAPNR